VSAGEEGKDQRDGRGVGCVLDTGRLYIGTRANAAEGNIMRKTSKKSGQGKRKTATVKDLSAKDAKAVKGGRKAGEKPIEY
jgi:hypothetical protein